MDVLNKEIEMPITPEQMSEWIAKTWKECQDRVWAEKPAG